MVKTKDILLNIASLVGFSKEPGVTENTFSKYEFLMIESKLKFLIDTVKKHEDFIERVKAGSKILASVENTTHTNHIN